MNEQLFINIYKYIDKITMNVLGDNVVFELEI